MSHLSLDARAILHYLNDLGYRNITAEQLKEFLKGMQPKPDKSGISSKYRTTNTTTTSTISAATAATLYQQQQQKPQQQKDVVPTTTLSSPNQIKKAVKIIKSKRPLCHFKFYLDICDHQLTKRIEDQIKALGGNLEFFLTENVTHFITDKTVITSLGYSSHPSTPQTPATPNTPQTSYSGIELTNDARFTRGGGATPIGAAGLKTRQSRADAILNRARRQSNNIVVVTAAATTSTTLTNLRTAVGTTAHTTLTETKSVVQQPPYKIWKTEQALSFFKKISTELRNYLEKGISSNSRGSGKGNVISLKGNFIKIEALKRNTRPYYHIIKKPDDWPKIDLTSDDGAFRLQIKQKPSLITADAAAQQQQVMTRKSRMRSSQQLQQHLTISNENQSQTTLLTTTVESLKKISPQFNSKKDKGSTTNTANTTPLRREPEESTDKQCGVCEICKIEYDTLTIHLKTKDHEYFVKNPNNFTALDKLIQSTADLNKFLNEGNLGRQDVGSDNSADIPEGLEVKEMEVDESLSKVEENFNDPLDDSTVSTSICSTTRPNSAESLKRRPSPALREKSKRITKGKHSSEKFQSKTTIKQSLANNKSVSPPQKKPAVSCMVELQRVDPVATAVNAITPATTRRKAAATSAATLSSPPIRAMLPPSSLYKVVETAETCTKPVRSRRNAIGTDTIEATASPSIIVKFQKVRQNEVQRLNGEAESFMFPRMRTSSDLHTDTDRQTTSERARASMSSTSIDSTSEMDLTGSTQHSSTSTRSDCGRKIAIACRRRGVGGAGMTATTVELQRKLSVGSNSSGSRQRFQNAPIQPKKQLKSRSATMTTAKSSIALPEATRKSSRTATAIVSKATTSSRLVRAQVEAAKQTNRQQQSAKVLASTAKPIKTQMNTRAFPEWPSTTARFNKRSGTLVVKKEDRMGENVAIQKKKPYVESVKDSNSENENNDEEDDEVEEEGVEDDDDEKDEDYVVSKASKNHSHAETTKLSAPLFESRDARAARRQARLNFYNKSEHMEEEIIEEHLSPPRKAAKKLASPPSIKEKVKVPLPKNKQTKNGCTSKGKTQPAPHIFDFTKSECLSKMTYAFECLPTADLWHQVFTRQDAGEERYHTYFDQTKYCKLPYELGPIPFNTTLRTNNCCETCNKTVTATAITSESVQGKINIKKELLNECEEQAQQSSSGVTPATKDHHEGTKSALYKHKKLHLLQRYQQEQALKAQQLVGNVVDPSAENEQKVAVVKPNPVTEIAPLGISHFVNTAISKCDSKASTPELFDREFVPLGELSTTERIRASSTHSNTSSSYASSTASQSKKAFRNKQLNRITELPPRKSPREHASTLALVSCIIRQRQDSLSKNNSEIDEPPTTPTPTLGINVITKFVEEKSNLNPPTGGNASNKSADIDGQPPTTPIKQSSPTPLEKQKLVASPRTTRSAAATPIEELRFTTEISENVKRMRRGQNKYDHSPPFVHNTTRRGRRATQMPLASTNSATLSRRLVMAAKQDLPASVVLGKRKRRDQLNSLSMVSKHRATHKSTHTLMNTTANGLSPSLSGVRKLGTKKGVLEFEFDNSAMKRLDVAIQHPNPQFEAWVIDRYLELAGKEYDIEATQFDVATTTDDNETGSENVISVREDSVGNAIGGVNTPPPTDCFTSDFDLYDLLTGIQPGNANAAAGCGDEEDTVNNRRNSFCFYSSTSLQSYYRKRKSIKSNRTGWPKAQKRKASTRQQRMLDEKISFEKIGIVGKELIQIKEEPLMMFDEKDEEEVEGDDQFNQDAQAINTVQTKKAANGDGAELEDDRGGGDNGGGGGVITPPATDDDDVDQNNIVGDNNTEPGADRVASCVDDESLIEDDETMAESIEIDEEEDEDDENDNTPEAEIDATDADVEEEVDDDDEVEDEEEERIEDDDDGDVGLLNIEENDEFEVAYDHDANDVDIFDDAQAAVNQSNPKKSESDINSSNEKRARLSPNNSGSSHEEQHKVLISLLNAKPSNMSTSLLATSTPTTQSTRQQQHNRRTPQLINGSLGSCISPSEKLGDHSDIFTVSSDGLDTDMDISNPHGQMKVDDEHRMDAHQCPHQTPKRKFDISKYAPGSAKASSCAAEAATAAAKSLAISQFLKKEVRVNCRRLRAPFRRFRYRR